MEQINMTINFNPIVLDVQIAPKNQTPIVEVIPGVTGMSAYQLAVKNGFTGTIFEWLASLKGEKVELRQTATNIQWKYETDVDWQDLVSLTDITGPKGDMVTHEWVGTALRFQNSDGSWGILVDLKGAVGDPGSKGDTGNGIASILKTNTVGLVDTYTITYTDETTSTFQITNGQNGINGKTPYIQDNYWYIDGVNTNIKALGENGLDITWKGTYLAETAYVVNDAVSYNGSSYICILASTGNLPTNEIYWGLLAQKGTDGQGAGDMLISVYDPTNKAANVFDYNNLDNKPTIPTKTSDLTNDSNFIVDASYVHTDNNYTDIEQTKLAGIDMTTKINKSGDTMTGKLILVIPDANKASINLPHGSAPAAPVNGDFWTTTATLYGIINGTTRTFYHNGNAATAALTTATQAEMEAGTLSTLRGMSPERVKQAILALAPVKSINAQTGIVVLDADDLDDTSTTHKFVLATDITTWNNKQEALISGTNIKTINGISLLGNGDIVISAAESGLQNIIEDLTPQLGGNLDTNGKNIDSITPTELGYLSGVTSAIQTQMDSKLDKLGGTMTGKLNLPACNATNNASFNIAQGSMPSLNYNGDIWIAGPPYELYIRLAGSSRKIYHDGNALTASLSTATQAEVEAGTSTTVKGFTPQRVAQAIVALAPVKSVNTKTGVVVITPDDLDDTSTTHKFVAAEDITNWNGKQAALSSGVNIKTINGVSILGAGDIVINSGVSTAAEVSYDNTVSLWSGTNVQDIIDELCSYSDNLYNSLDEYTKIVTSLGSADPDITTVPMILTDHANTPTGSGHWFIFSYFSTSASVSSGHSQIALGYGTNVGTWVRSYDSGTSTWSAWKQQGIISYGITAPVSLLPGELYIQY